MTNDETKPSDPYAHLTADERAEAMSGMRGEGQTLQEIADRFHLTRERVRQIIEDAGGPTAAEAQAARRQQKVQQREQLRSSAEALLLRGPGRSAEEVAAELGVTVPVLRQALGPKASLILVASHKPSSKYTDEQMLEHLRMAEKVVGARLTVRGYRDVHRGFGGVSGPSVIQRFGSWQAACRLAGVNHGQSVRAQYARRWTQEQMVQSVATYLASEGARGSFTDYEAWARRQDGVHPSGQTIRSNFGRWSVAKARAIALLGDRGGLAG